MGTRKQKTCPLCGKGQLVPKEENHVFEYKLPEGKRSIKVPKLPVEMCNRCGEKFRGPAAAKKEHLFLAKDQGILTPDEIKRIRRIFSASRPEFARLTGIDEQTITEWEAGRVIPTRAMDQYLRLLVFFPHRSMDGFKLLRTNPIPL